MDSTYIFYHIPKTGGQSIRAALAQQLKIHEELIHLGPMGEDDAKNRGLMKWQERPIQERAKAKFIMGHHVNKHTENLLPSNKLIRKMVILRNPVDQIISLYNFSNRFRRKPIPFNIWYKLLMVKGGNNFQCTNFFRNFLLQSKLRSFFLSINSYDYFIEELTKFWFISTTEYINEDFKKLLPLMGLAQTAVHQTNVAGVNYPKKLTVNSDIEEKLIKNNELDYKVYLYAKKLRKDFWNKHQEF